MKLIRQSELSNFLSHTKFQFPTCPPGTAVRKISKPKIQGPQSKLRFAHSYFLTRAGINSGSFQSGRDFESYSD